MLQSPVSLATIRFPLAGHFLRNLGESPWTIISGGRRRSFSTRTFDKMAEWIGKTHSQQLNAYAVLPDTGGHVWHLAASAPIDFRIGEMRLPPSMVISADQFYLLWRLNEPIKPAEAQRLSKVIANRTGGKSMVGELIPLPGTILLKKAGARLVSRFPVQMLPPVPTAYRIVDGELRAPRLVGDDNPFVRADEVDAKPMEWLWPNLIPLGTLTLLGGAAGMGKSQAAISMAAIVSSGGSWPTGENCTAASALILEAEDDIERTITPRLLAAGADLTRISLGKTVDLSQGPEILEAEARRRKNLRLIVLSPIRKFIGNAELYGNLGVREVIDPLMQWAEKERVAIVGIAHPPKDKENKAAFAGNAAYLELARAAYSVIPDPTSDEPIMKHRPRILVAAKSNLAPDDITLGYRIEGATVNGLETSRVVWTPIKK